MQIFKIPFLAYCLITLICGCVREQTVLSDNEIENSFDFKVIKVEEVIDKQHIDSVISDYYYIPLQTNDQCLFGKVDKILIDKDRIYIIDVQTDGIYAFKKNGNFDFKIFSKGKGPGEYYSITDVELIDSTNQLVVLCVNRRKVLYFSSINGEFIKEQSLDFGALAMAAIDSEKFLFDCKYKMDRGTGDFSLVSTDSKLNPQNGYFPRVNHPSTEGTPFTKYNGAIYYCSNYSYNIFAYHNNNLTRKYMLDFGNKELRISDLPDELFTARGVLDKKIIPFLNKKKFLQYISAKDIAYHVTSVLESDSFIRFNFVYKGRIANAVVNKKTNKVKTYMALEQDTDYCFDRIKTVYDDHFIGAIDASFLVEVMNRTKNDEQKSNILNFIDSNDIDPKYNNPFLIFVKYKNF